MSTEENKAIIRRYIEEAFNHGNLGIIDELIAPDFTDHAAAPGLAPAREGQRQFVAMYRQAFPDLQTTIEDMIAEGDKVVTRWSARGTQQGELMGLPPSGRPATISGITINRIASGTIVEGWNNFDQLGLLQQLGVIPAPGQGGA
jgi:steroid delta-isomerase-like uncharacterized protein